MQSPLDAGFVDPDHVSNNDVCSTRSGIRCGTPSASYTIRTVAGEKPE